MQLHEAVETRNDRVELEKQNQGEPLRQHIAMSGGILGALAASSCCVVPLLLFSLGIGGAWISNLTALAPYKPLFMAAAATFLGYGFYSVYWKRKRACITNEACARPLPNRFVKTGLWIAAVLIVIAFAFDYVVPILLPA